MYIKWVFELCFKETVNMFVILNYVHFWKEETLN